MSRSNASISRYLDIAALGVIVAAAPVCANAQEPGAKPRLELSDSAMRDKRAARADANAPRAEAKPAETTLPAPAAPAIAAGFRGDFVRNQAILGALLYAPTFATTVARNDIAWGATFLFAAGGAYVGAAEFSRQVKVTDPMHHLATHLPIRGALAGAMLSELSGANREVRATAMLAGGLGGTVAGLWRGRAMDAGEAAATVFGSDVLGLAGYGIATGLGVTEGGRANRTRLTATVAGMIVGAPAGQAYAALAPYNVSAGDVTAMTASAGVGMLAALTAVSNGDRSERHIALALSVGGLAGLVAGDLLLVRRYDHTPAEGRMMVAGGLAGGLMGAGVALLSGSASSRWTPVTAGLTTLGAAGGVLLAQRQVGPRGDGGLRLGGLDLNPIGVVAAAAGARGSYTLGSIRF